MARSFHLMDYMRKEQKTVPGGTRSWSKEPSKFDIIWFLLFSITALGLTLAVSFSCSTVATSNLHMHSVSPAALIQGLSSSSNTTRRSGNNISTTTKDLWTAKFGIADLPDQYLFGISGLCRHWNQTGETKCRYHFPQVPSLLEAVREDSGSSSIQDNWTQLLTHTKISNVEKNTLYRRFVTAAAGLLITSIFFAFGIITFTLFRPEHLKLSIFLDIVDAIMAIAAAIMWSNIETSQASALKAAAPEATRVMLDQMMRVGPGLGFIWGLAWCKILVTPVMMLVLLFIALVVPLICCAACLDDSQRVEVHHYYE